MPGSDDRQRKAGPGVSVSKFFYSSRQLTSNFDSDKFIFIDIVIAIGKAEMQNTTNQTGKAAVFIRGFMEHFQEQWEKNPKPVPLRACQDAGAAAVADLGDEISVAYISKIGRELAADKVIKKSKKGRNYFVEPSEWTDSFWVDFLPGWGENWGKELNPDAINEMHERDQIIKFVKKHRGVVIYQDQQLPKAMYSYLMKKFNEGKLKLAFLMPDDVVMVHSKEEDEKGYPWEEHEVTDLWDRNDVR